MNLKFDTPLDSKSVWKPARVGMKQLRASSYDISATCNLTCEGCLFFAREDGISFDDAEHTNWAARFRDEASRGVNFAYLAGAEPTLAPDRIAAAWKYIKAGVIFTNGTKKIDPEIGYRIHVSLWGLGEMAATLRGGDSVAKALRNFGNDPRAVFVLTISKQNISQIQEVAEKVATAGGTLTFSYFSPTLAYQHRTPDGSGNAYMRLDDDMRMNEKDLARARSEIEHSMARFPSTIKYSRDYDDWVRQPGSSLYEFDEYGVAVDCGNRLTQVHRHYTHDGNESSGKCCSPNIDCSECRAYAMAFGTFVSRDRVEQKDRRARARAMRLWYDLFMPLRD